MAREESTGEHNHQSLHAVLVDVDDGQGGIYRRAQPSITVHAALVDVDDGRGGIYRRAQPSITVHAALVESIGEHNHQSLCMLILVSHV